MREENNKKKKKNCKRAFKKVERREEGVLK